MTPQERDLITALLGRLQQQAGQSKDPEAESLIRQGLAAQPDAPYLLVQTVLIQDLTLHDAQRRIAELEDQLAARPAATAAPSFLGGRGSVPSAGAWPQTAAPAAPGPVWTQSRAGAAAPQAASPQPALSPPQMLSGSGGGFLRQAATTAAGIAGGALLFDGIRSLFGPHYGGGFLGGMPMQPGLSETVINNYYGEPGAQSGQADLQGVDPGNDPGLQSADVAGDAFQGDAAGGFTDDQSFADDGNQDVGSDGSDDV